MASVGPLTRQSDVAVGDTMIVFNSHEWGGKDQGDNRQFFQSAEILEVGLTKRSAWSPGGEEVATVWFPSGRVSRGHFTNFMRRPSLDEKRGNANG